MSTNLNQVAAERGYPSTLLGFTPADSSYWREPGLPWVASPDRAPQLVRNLSGPARHYAEFIFTSDEMSPRFPTGTIVELEQVLSSDAWQVGRVYVYLPATQEPQAGRLAHVGHATLELTQDNDPTRLRWPVLPGPQGEVLDLYLVTHYSHYPAQEVEEAGALPVGGDDSPALLLELSTDEMSPRYPRGARYVIRPVPVEAWPQARGVHALTLRDGRQLVRRLFHQAKGVLALTSDRTGDAQTLPLAEIASLWKLGEADYLPAETEAEHQWMIQQSIS